MSLKDIICYYFGIYFYLDIYFYLVLNYSLWLDLSSPYFYHFSFYLSILFRSYTSFADSDFPFILILGLGLKLDTSFANIGMLVVFILLLFSIRFVYLPSRYYNLGDGLLEIWRLISGINS